MRRGALVWSVLACLAWAVWTGGVALAQVDEGDESELFGLHAGEVFSLVTEAGEKVTELTVGASVGDSFIDEENNLYVVTRVEGSTAIVEARGKAEMPDVSDALEAMERLGASAGEAGSAWSGFFSRLLAGMGMGGARNEVGVGLYHTHNAESYVPTSGKDSEPYGDIHEVGKALQKEFEKLGIGARWTDNSHLPHDGQAYVRSRRTAIELSRERPQTIIDVHRDAIPTRQSYATTVNGIPMSQIRLVVGRQNQNREANLEYAKRIKAIADEKYPGLIKGIYHARGNYNQDLGPKMILLEFGTHVTSLEEAIRSTEPIARTIAAAAGLGGGGGTSAREGSAGFRSAIWILVLVGVGALGWYFLNKEGILGSGGKGRDGA